MKRLPLRPLGWALNALGIAVTVTFGVWPVVRDWCLDHAGVGWSVAILLLVTCAVLGQVMYHWRSAHASLASENDARLLAESLGDWKQNSYLTDFFTNGFIGFVMPTNVATDIADRVARWRNDGRQLHDPVLRERFLALVLAAATFWESTGEMFMEDGANGSRLEIPKEWKQKNRKRYDAAYDSISTAGADLHRALNELFAAMHDRGLPT